MKTRSINIYDFSITKTNDNIVFGNINSENYFIINYDRKHINNNKILINNSLKKLELIIGCQTISYNKLKLVIDQLEGKDLKYEELVITKKDNKRKVCSYTSIVEETSKYFISNKNKAYPKSEYHCITRQSDRSPLKKNWNFSYSYNGNTINGTSYHTGIDKHKGNKKLYDTLKYFEEILSFMKSEKWKTK